MMVGVRPRRWALERYGRLFLALSSATAFIIIFCLIVMVNPPQSQFYGLECQWKLLTCHNSWAPTENYGCEQNNQHLDTAGDWNESLLASLGLISIPNSNNSGITNEEFDSSDEYPARIPSRSSTLPECGFDDKLIRSQEILQRILEVSTTNQWCDTLRNFTDENRSTVCYQMMNQNGIDEFLRQRHDLNVSWRIFRPYSMDSSYRVLTTNEIYKALRWKRLLVSDKSILVPIRKNSLIMMGHKNSSIMQISFLRIFFLVRSLIPLHFQVFPEGILFLNKDSQILPLDELFAGQAGLEQRVFRSTARWIEAFLSRAKLQLSAEEFKHFSNFGKVSKILAADFHIHETENDPLELVRVFSRVPEQLISETSSSSFNQLLMYKILSGSVHFLSNSVAFKDSSASLLSLIDTLKWIKSDEVELYPSFRPMWTDYSATVPYRAFQLALRLTVNENTDEIHFDGRKIQTSKIELNLGIGLGLNHFEIRLTNKNPRIHPVTYRFRLHRLGRRDNPLPWNTLKNLTSCILEQECGWKFKSGSECGLHPTNITNTQLPICSSGDAEGAWMVPCEDCEVEGSCYWSRAIWQPFSCRYNDDFSASTTDHHQHHHHPSRSLRQCLARRKLIFVGDSTNRGMMESLLERLDGSLTTSDRIKWHEYRHRTAGYNTDFHFDYYPKFWKDPLETFQETLLNVLRRAGAKREDSILIVGGVDWISIGHLDVIREVLQMEGLSGMRVVVKTSGASGLAFLGRSSSGGMMTHHRNPADEALLIRKALIETTIRSNGLALKARLPPYGFRTVETWNMTAARFRDFLPGGCQCHFNQITKVEQQQHPDPSDPTMADEEIEDETIRFRAEGPINQAYTQILADQLCF